MTPGAAAVVVALVLGGVALGASLDAPTGLVFAGAVSIAVVVAFVGAEARRVRALAETVNAWLGPSGYRPVSATGSGAWREFAIAVNALGAAYERRGTRISRERPWRRELVDALVSPALLFSAESRLLAANDAARELLGIPIDARDVTVVQAVGSAALAGAVAQVQANGDPVTVEAEQGGRDLRAVASRVGDEMLLIVTDRTHERRVEEVRRNFVVNASHELKTPVTGIRTLTEAMAVTLDRGDTERLRSLVGRLDQEADRLARLVHDLLDLRRLEERGPLERVPVDVAELVRRVVAGLVDRAEERGVSVEVDAPDRAYVAGVPTDIQVIVENLVANAIQYNREGGRVTVELAPGDGAHVLHVRDTGIGIAQHDHARVFERFYRVDPGRSRESGGTGLGLAIVRHAVERHDGTVTVDSLLGEGTTFTVTLPIAAR